MAAKRHHDKDAACRTPCNPWDMRFPLCVGRICDCTNVLLSLRPFLPGLRGRLPFLVRLVHGYYVTVRLLLYVRVRRSVFSRAPGLFPLSVPASALQWGKLPAFGPLS